MSGALNDQALQRATLTIPCWGIWCADVQTDSGELLELGSVAALELGGLQLSGAIIGGEIYNDAGWYRLVGGTGGWRKTIGQRSYRSEPGVKLSTVLQDAARECGEKLGTVPPTPIGPSFFRPTAEASAVLDLLQEESWFVDNDGTTRLGSRTEADFVPEYAVMRSAPSSPLITVACEELGTLLPGAVLPELGEVASVRHELTPEGLRSHLYGFVDDKGADRFVGDLKALVLALTRHNAFHARCEYKVTKAGDGYLDLRPIRTSLGYPDLANVPQRVGIPGGGGDPAIGSSVLVGFVDGDPTRAYVSEYIGEGGNAWLPTKAKLDTSGKLELGASSVLTEIAGGDQFAALANLVKGELDTLAGLYSSHTHSIPTGNSGGPNGTYTPGDVAATKVKVS